MKGICFKEPLFHAILKGDKTQTRRIMKPQADEVIFDDFTAYGRHFGSIEEDSYGFDWRPIYPRFKKGDVVYLKEPYQLAVVDESPGYGYFYGASDIRDFSEDLSWFKETIPDEDWCRKWNKYQDKRRNKLFMPASAARHYIKITAVRPERLQDISEKDCIKEGIVEIMPQYGWDITYTIPGSGRGFHNPQQAYACLIDSIDGKDTWESNPWMWVYDFELWEGGEE